jgi:actin-like protein 6A
MIQGFKFILNSKRVAQARPKKMFEFPNGFSTSLGRTRFQIPECLFDPSQIVPTPTTQEFVGIHQLAHAAVQASDGDSRTLLYTNVVLTGGNTLLPGFADRLHYELNMLAPGIKVRLHAAGSSGERKFGAWIGGSVLASLGTFHQLWISKGEWSEGGAGVLETR